jgi:hypothetical protein
MFWDISVYIDRDVDICWSSYINQDIDMYGSRYVDISHRYISIYMDRRISMTRSIYIDQDMWIDIYIYMYISIETYRSRHQNVSIEIYRYISIDIYICISRSIYSNICWSIHRYISVDISVSDGLPIFNLWLDILLYVCIVSWMSRYKDLRSLVHVNLHYHVVLTSQVTLPRESDMQAAIYVRTKYQCIKRTWFIRFFFADIVRQNTEYVVIYA